MTDWAGIAALIAALGGLAISLIENRRLREADAQKTDAQKGDALVALRIRELDAVEEFRETLRKTVKDQGERIVRLESELEGHRAERLKHGAERLEWFHEREEFKAEIEHLKSLQARVEALEKSLGESELREAELQETLRSERDSWSTQRRGLEGRIHSLELALRAAGVDVPHEKNGSG